MVVSTESSAKTGVAMTHLRHTGELGGLGQTPVLGSGSRLPLIALCRLPTGPVSPWLSLHLWKPVVLLQATCITLAV